MHTYYISFGSNVGDRIQNILKAIELLKEIGKIDAISTIYESPPWGVEDQPEFLNGVLRLKTHTPPIELLTQLKEIEKKVGRKERQRWGPREIDLDILLCDNAIIMLSFLVVPHPHMTERDFVLFPLLEIERELIHPLYKKPLKEYAKGLKNNLKPYACILAC